MVDTQCPFCREKDEELARLRYATIPPEAGENLIERLKEYDSDSMWEGGLNPPFRQVFKDAAATIRSLAAENEELKDQVKRLREIIKAYTDVGAEAEDRAEKAEAGAVHFQSVLAYERHD